MDNIPGNRIFKIHNYYAYCIVFTSSVQMCRQPKNTTIFNVQFFAWNAMPECAVLFLQLGEFPFLTSGTSWQYYTTDRGGEWYPKNRWSRKILGRFRNLGNVSTESWRLVFFLFGSEIA